MSGFLALRLTLKSNIAILRNIIQEENRPRLARSVQEALEEKPTKRKCKKSSVGALGRRQGPLKHAKKT
jgi:hypothetical protein